MTLDTIIITFAFSAGAIAFLNPCGFAMLPTYIAYFIESNYKSSFSPSYYFSNRIHNGVSHDINCRFRLIRKIGIGASIGLIVTISFISIFGLTGLAVSAAGTEIIKYFPWIAVLSGIIIIGIGISKILGKTIYINIPIPRIWSNNIGIDNKNNDSVKINRKSKYLKFFLFGIGYAIASLSCTLPIFLLIVFQGLSAGGILEGFIVFLTYALGMGTVMIAVSLAISISNHAFVRWIGRLSPKINVITGIVLIIAGLYLLYYNIVVGKLLFI